MYLFSKTVFKIGQKISGVSPRFIASLSALSESHRKFQKTIQDFVNAEIVECASKFDRERKYPEEIIKKMAQMGLMSVNVPKDLGGAGLDTLSYAIAMEEISRGCASCGCIMTVHNSLYLAPLLQHGNKEQIENYVKPFLTGERVGFFGLTELYNGSDPSRIETEAKEDCDNYILNGVKMWISNSAEACAGVVFATTDKALKHKGISAFIVPAGTEGLTVCEKEELLGIRGSSACRVNFENASIPKENILGKAGNGFVIAMQALESGRIGVASQAIGIGRAALELAVDFAEDRRALGNSISKLQPIQFKLSDMAMRLEAARLLTWRAAWLKDNKKPFGKESAMAKCFASEAATYCAHQCIQILGGIGYSANTPAERYYRDARITEIYEGTSEILRVIIARHVLKENEKPKPKK